MSSARFKRDIRDMGASSDDLMKLRPVTFRYKDDPAGTLQYGLVAEEVDKLYPELVTHSADRQVQSVRYSMLTGMLLNELQKQARENQGQAHQLARETERLQRLTTQLRRQAEQVRKLNARVAEVEVSTRGQLSAQRAAFEQCLSALEQGIRARNGNRRLTDGPEGQTLDSGDLSPARSGHQHP